MRTLLALLLLANLGFLALANGWLEPLAGLSTAREREPARLAQQIEPQALRVLDARAASAALTAAQAVECLQAGPLPADQLPALEAVLAQQQPAIAWQRVRDESAAAPRWWLRVERADRAAAQRLRQLPGGFVPCR